MIMYFILNYLNKKKKKVILITMKILKERLYLMIKLKNVDMMINMIYANQRI